MPTTIDGYSFTDTRISTLLNADTLDDARCMGVLDRSVDYFWNYVKWDAIESAFTAITARDNEHVDRPEARKLARFDKLCEMVKSEHAGKFALEVALDEDAQTWSYTFWTDDTAIATKTGIPLGDGKDYAAYQGTSMLRHATQALSAAGRNDLMDAVSSLRVGFSELDARHEVIEDFASLAAAKFALLAPIMSQARIPMEIQLVQRERYSLAIDNQLVHSGALRHAQNASDSQFVAVVAARIRVAIHDIFRVHGETLTDPRSLMEANVQCMVDGHDEQARLLENLSSPAFCKARFSGIEDVSSPTNRSPTFIARFNEQSLVFSNRLSTNNELRGERLKALLQNSDYTCLEDLARHGHLTESDAMLLYAFAGEKYDFYGAHLERMSGDECALLGQEVAGYAVGNTTLGALWKLNPAAPAANETSI